jgi:hypothetical protein
LAFYEAIGNDQEGAGRNIGGSNIELFLAVA